MLPFSFPKHTPAVKQCRLLPRLLDGSVVHAPTPTRMLHAVSALRARPGARSAMPSWLAQRRPRWQGQQEWIIVIRLALLRCQQLGLLLPGSQLQAPTGPLLERCPMPPYGLPAVVGSATMHHGRAPQLRGNCASVVICLVNTMVNIVGTSAKDRGRNCPFHTCCGMQL